MLAAVIWYIETLHYLFSIVFLSICDGYRPCAKCKRRQHYCSYRQS